MINLTINGNVHAVDASPEMPLLWVLRDKLQMMGTKFGCGIAQCGACTVQINGVAVRSCVTPVSAVGDAKVTTIEGLSEHGDSPVQKAWVAHQVPQCGFCQSGMLMSTVGEMKAGNHGASIRPNNLCVCGTYARIKEATQTL